MTLEQVITIGEFSRIVGRSVQTVRTWDATGKLPANRTATGERYYSQQHVEQAQRLVANGARR